MLLGLIISSALSAATVKDCTTLDHHGKLGEAKACYTALLDSGDPYTRAEGLWGLERYQDANDQFKVAIAAQPKNANIRVRWGLSSRAALSRVHLPPAQLSITRTLLQRRLSVPGRTF